MDYTWLFGTFAKCDFLAGVYMEIAGGTAAGDGIRSGDC